MGRQRASQRDEDPTASPGDWSDVTPEGLSAPEVGKEIGEHSRRTKRDSDHRHDSLLSITEALLLSLVAVLAGGIDVSYPAGHAAMLNRIGEEGLIVTE